MQKLYRNKYRVLIEESSGVFNDYSSNILFPIKWGALLDEQLDEASLTLLNTSTANFKPFTRVNIELWNERENETLSLFFVISGDSADELPVGSGKYKHLITLIEETKYLERFIVRSHGYINSIIKSYTQIPVPYTDIPGQDYSSNNQIYPNANQYFTPIEGDSVEIINPIYLCSNSIKALSTYGYLQEIEILGGTIKVNYTDAVNESENTVINYSNSPVTVTKSGGQDIIDGNFQNYTYPLRSGIVDIAYNVNVRFTFSNGNGGIGEISDFIISYYYENIVVTTASQGATKWNARTVIERALAITETLREGESPRFSLNLEQAEEFENIETPEFSFTQSTLREILQDVGKYVHGEPRLRNGVIYYDMYGSNEMNEVSASGYMSKTYNRNVEQYATRLVSNVDNLVSSLDFVKGSITEPYFGDVNGFKTLRTETLYARIEDGNAIISTQFPIYAVTELRWRGNSQNNNTPVDITPFVYESTEYERLSSYSDIYPTSRLYAIYYTQGEKNIKGLWFKRQKAWGEEFGEYSIKAILEKASGVNNLSFTEINELNRTGSTYPEMAFQITYVPIYSAQVGQTKSYIGEFDKPNALSFNQGQNLIEASYYGENLKGVIARMGNIEKTLCYVRWGLPILPKVGTLFDDDYYISTVSVEVQPYTTKVLLGLSKDFNRLSQYVGINSLKRFYEISERQSVESNITYTDYVIVGDEVSGGGDTLFDARDSVSGLLGIYGKICALLVEGFDEGNYSLGKILLPVQAFSVGNSVVMTAKYNDNYSAGQQAQKESTDSVIGYWANGVPYKDIFGNIEKLSLDYQRQIFSQPVQSRYDLPLAEGLTPSETLISTNNGGKLVVKVGSTEVPTINYEIDYVSNRKDLIIGSALAKSNRFVSNEGRTAKAYILPYRLNKLSKKVDISNAIDLGTISRTIMPNGVIKIAEQVATANGKAWAIVIGGELAVGCNRNITAGEEDIFKNLYFTAKHNIF